MQQAIKTVFPDGQTLGESVPAGTLAEVPAIPVWYCVVDGVLMFHARQLESWVRSTPQGMRRFTTITLTEADMDSLMHRQADGEPVAVSLRMVGGPDRCDHIAKVVEYSERPGRVDVMLVSESDTDIGVR